MTLSLDLIEVTLSIIIGVAILNMVGLKQRMGRETIFFEDDRTLYRARHIKRYQLFMTWLAVLATAMSLLVFRIWLSH